MKLIIGHLISFKLWYPMITLTTLTNLIFKTQILIEYNNLTFFMQTPPYAEASNW